MKTNELERLYQWYTDLVVYMSSLNNDGCCDKMSHVTKLTTWEGGIFVDLWKEKDFETAHNAYQT